jgi:hypothetical protein
MTILPHADSNGSSVALIKWCLTKNAKLLSCNGSNGGGMWINLRVVSADYCQNSRVPSAAVKWRKLKPIPMYLFRVYLPVTLFAEQEWYRSAVSTPLYHSWCFDVGTIVEASETLDVTSGKRSSQWADGWNKSLSKFWQVISIIVGSFVYSHIDRIQDLR